MGKSGTLRTTPLRSALMKRVRQKRTAAEERVLVLLREIGARYRINVRGLPGTPDVANRRRRKAIFVNGCFWHAHRNCARATVPTANRSFWSKKLQANVERDRRKVAALKRAGFEVLVIWECQLADPVKLRTKLVSFWRPRGLPASHRGI